MIGNFSNQQQGHSELWVGGRCLILSAFAFSLMSACVKSLQGRLPIAEIILARSLFSLLITRIMIMRTKISPWGNNRKLLLLRGILGTLALFCVFHGISTLPLATATIIQYTYPTLTAIAAWLLLKEKISGKICFAVILGWAGVMIVAEPLKLLNKEILFDLNVFIALMGALLTALAYICVRKLSKEENQLVIVYYFPLLSIPITIPLVLQTGLIPTSNELFLLLGVGLFTQLGQLWITKGLSIIPAAKACSINYAQVIFASFIGVIFFGEIVSLKIILGAILVLSATILSFQSTHTN